MRYFIYRNNTIESLFAGFPCDFSGYDDVSFVPDNADRYVWFYQPPFNFDTEQLTEELNTYYEKCLFVYNRIPRDKDFIIVTLENIFSVRITDGDGALRTAIEEFNARAYELASTEKNVKVFDFSRFITDNKTMEMVDWRFYLISQMALNPRLAKPFKKWLTAQIDGMEFKRKKCLVLDLDNTLWGGVLGEDGIDGIQIGGDYPGKAFMYFQQALLALSKSGIILTVCSKNNETDVLEAWEKNPFIVLRKEHFSAYRINWQNKADNIVELSKELNIGLDSMVFVDDNPTERELVRQNLPMVEVPEFPLQPYELPQFYEQLVKQYFHIYDVTEEDKVKTAQYKANAERARIQNSFSDLSDYIKSLDICITIEAANDFNIARIAQMTQKTNQFNLTTKRYTESDIRRFIEEGRSIWCISVKDRFGDNGITGCIIVDGDRIDTLLLSCRILGKEIEYAFVKTILSLLKNNGINTLYAEYLPTAKNGQVADFYDRCGMNLSDIREDGSKVYSVDLENVDLNIKDIYQIIIQ